MEFAREVWFLLRNVPALAHRYKKKSFWAILFLLLSVASTLTHRFLNASSNHQTYLIWISWASYFFTAAVFTLAFVDLAKNRLPFNDLVCKEKTSDAYYHVPAENSYETVVRMQCINRTNQPIRDLAPIQDGYYEQIPSWKVQHGLLGNPQVKLVVHKEHEEVRKSNFSGGAKTIYLYQANAEFQPPLPPGDRVDLLYEVLSTGTTVEEAAFSNDGTMFVGGVSYDTLTYIITVHAPPAHEIQLRDWGVINANGDKIPEETDHQKKARVCVSSGLLQWRVSLARKHLRYMLKYRFKALL